MKYTSEADEFHFCQAVAPKRKHQRKQEVAALASITRTTAERGPVTAVTATLQLSDAV